MKVLPGWIKSTQQRQQWKRMLRKIYGIEESSVCIARWDMLFVLLVCKLEEGVVRRDVVWWKRRRSRIDRLWIALPK
eukprot:scaffold393_cov147-Skeletonema_marinoi.AAC.8